MYDIYNISVGGNNNNPSPSIARCISKDTSKIEQRCTIPIYWNNIFYGHILSDIEKSIISMNWFEKAVNATRLIWN